VNGRRATLLGSLGLALVTLALYSGSLKGGFVYDDHWAIERNPALALAPAWLFWTDPETGANPASGLTKDIYRPLTVFSFAESLRVWGKHLTFWRLENILWHVINGILFAFLLRRWGWPAGPGLLFAVAVFLLHPIQVSSVAWIYQRSTLLSTAGCLAALLMIVGKESLSWVRISGSLFFLSAALFAKESAVMLPFIFWVISEKKISASWRRRYLACSAACVAGFLVIRMSLLGWSQIADVPRGWAEKMLLTVIAVPQYAAKFFIPWGLRASYDLPALTPALVLTGILGSLIFGICFYALFRQRSKSGWMFGLWSLMALIPMLPVLPIRAFFADRFFYGASLGAAALLGLFIQHHRRFFWPAAVWLLILSPLTYRYAKVWSSDRTLWAWTVQREPSNAFAHMCLAEALSDPQDEQAQYFQALVNHPSGDMMLAAWNNLSVIALAQHEPEKALYWTAQILKHRPNTPQALYNRWRALKAVGNKKQADALRKVLMKDPHIPQQLFL
jgi:hypothetical protein